MIKLWELTPLGQVTQKINVVINIDKTQHAAERQNRSADFTFADEDIINIVNIATPKIAKMLMLNELNIGDTLHIKHKDLNIIGQLQQKQFQLEYTVITVMKKQNFIPKTGTKSIQI